MKSLKVSVLVSILGLSVALLSLAPKAEAAGNAALFFGQSNYPTLHAGESAEAYIMYRNIGSQTWYDSTTVPYNGTGMANLATTNPMNRSSIFSKTWPSASRPATQFAAVYETGGALAANQHTAKPGEIVKYKFTFSVPTDTKPGTYREWFQPVLDGAPNWDIGGQAWLDVKVLPTTFQATLISDPQTVELSPGKTERVTLRYKNTGTGIIKDTTGADDFRGPFGNLATSTPMNRISLFATKSWNQGNRPALNFDDVYEANGTTRADDQHVALPGQIFTYKFEMIGRPGVSNGTYHEWFQPVLDNAPNWDIGGQAYVDVVFTKGDYKVQYFSQSAYPTIKAGKSATGYFMFKNVGPSPLFDTTSINGDWGMANLAASNPINRFSIFRSGWINGNRPAVNFAAVYEYDGATLAVDQHVAYPSQIVKYQFTFTVPAGTPTGTYREWFQPILEGAPNWDMGGQVFLNVKVTQ